MSIGEAPAATPARQGGLVTRAGVSGGDASGVAWHFPPQLAVPADAGMMIYSGRVTGQNSALHWRSVQGELPPTTARSSATAQRTRQ